MTDYIILHIKQININVRDIIQGKDVIFRPGTWHRLVEGEIATIEPNKIWKYKGYTYLTGKIIGSRIDINYLNIMPLILKEEFLWDPIEIFGEDIREEYAEYLAGGLRVAYEMEQRIPSIKNSSDDDPICTAMDILNQGDAKRARAILVGELHSDWACLDAHNHLGLMAERRKDYEAMKKHYEIAAKIGNLTVGDSFEGVLPWIMIDNRPFLRSLHGYGLALWQLGQKEEALKVFQRSYYLCPDDGLGIRFLIQRLKAGKSLDDE
jgi:tetratricopeptide (TPR) repeat protein